MNDRLGEYIGILLGFANDLARSIFLRKLLSRNEAPHEKYHKNSCTLDARVHVTLSNWILSCFRYDSESKASKKRVDAHMYMVDRR